MTTHARTNPVPAVLAGRNRIGVTILVVTAEAEVLFCPDGNGWTLPGGEVQPGESATHALQRELVMTAGLEPQDPFLLTLISGPDTYQKLDNGEEIYDFNAVYVVRDWHATALSPQGRFFRLDALPPGLSVTDSYALQELHCCWGIC